MNKIANHLNNFYKRWNITYNDTEQFKDFKKRIINSIDITLGKLFIENTELEKQLIKILGLTPKSSFSSTHYPGLTGIKTLIPIQGYTKEFRDSKLWEILIETNYLELIKYIQVIFWLNINKDLKDKFLQEVSQDIEYSNMQLIIKETTKGVILYPKGAKLLDEKVINDTLNWLSDYPKSKNKFESALSEYIDKKNKRTIVDTLRLSLELFLKKMFSNKSLENQKEDILNYLQDKAVPKEIRNMYWKLLDSYCNYQNDYAKHDDKVDEQELEFIIYLTAIFMRFLITLEKN